MPDGPIHQHASLGQDKKTSWPRCAGCVVLRVHRLTTPPEAFYDGVHIGNHPRRSIDHYEGRLKMLAEGAVVLLDQGSVITDEHRFDGPLVGVIQTLLLGSRLSR